VFRYRIIYSRRRSISISVSPDKGVTVRAPLRASLSSIEKFVNSRSEWVLRHLNNFENHTRLNGKVSEGAKVLFTGNEYTVRICNAVKGSVVLSENEIIINAPVDKDPLTADKTLRKWYYGEAARLIPEKISEMLIRYGSYGFNPSMITIRTMKRRWGSCSSKGRITINSELVKIDGIFTEYVILHELCHLKHHNHGAGYYELLSEVFPDWKNVRKELRKYLS
jgi:predicted metal-dependent hydrolase